MLLIHPPIVKPCEPPAGLAKLVGALRRYGVRACVIDANLEGLLSLLEGPLPSPSDRWTGRAFRNRFRNLSFLRDKAGYTNFDRYSRAVMDLNRAIEKSSAAGKGRISLGNFQHHELSPVRSTDLLAACERPEENPFYPYFQKRLLEAIEREGHGVVGFSLNYLSQALCTFAMMGFLRKVFPGVTIVLGGGLVTSWMRRPGWENPFGGLVDCMVAGPGELPLLRFLGIDPARKEPWIPVYDPFTAGGYLSPGFVLPYSGSTGCYWNRCDFCPERAEGNRYSPAPVRTVLEHLEHLVATTQPALIHLSDNALSPALLKGLAENPPRAPWYGFARITCHLTDPDFCAALKRAGCAMLKLGLESGDQEVLDREHKGIDLETTSRALETLKKAGIPVYGYLLFGTPSETLASARKTLEFTVRHSDAIEFLNLAIFNLPAYGPEAEALEIEPLYEGDLSLYTGFHHPKGWDRKSVRHFLDKEYRRHPALARILRNDPPLFTSNHAPFFGSFPTP